MATPSLQQARSHYARQRRITAAALSAIRSLFAQNAPLTEVVRTVATYQLASATASARTVSGFARSASTMTNPGAFAGVSSHGFPIAEPIVATIDRFVPAPAEALPANWWGEARDFMSSVEQLIISEIQDAGRAASQTEFVARPDWTNYVRLLNPPSCGRCAVLAGRIYRDLDAFKRHPQCDCVMVPVTDWESAHDAGLVASPQAAFDAGHINDLSQADRQAIADGADITAVVNARSGMATEIVFGRKVKTTTQGTTKRAAWRQANPTRLVRLRPETIYNEATDRDDAIRLLKASGYIKADADEPRSSAGAGGSGHVPPPAGSTQQPGPDDWDARRAALTTELAGERIEPHEIEFLERFERRGEVVRWIPTSEHMLPTNDFVWRSNGNLLTELKSTKAKYSTIRGRIESAVRKAERAAVTKENFVIDLGAEHLSRSLRDDLAGYNAGRRRYRIARLWILSEDGQHLDEIALRS